MTNEAKAIEILSGFDPLGALEEMAEWKDQQFKEFIEKLKKWLKENTHDSSDERRCCSVYCAQDDFISDFETYMNKLWEEQK